MPASSSVRPREAVGCRRRAMPTAAPTPKAVLHQRFGAKARYTVEEMREAVGGCPGLAPQTRSVYRCALELPGLSVTTPGTFVRKKDAEQAAAQIALDKVRPRAVRRRPPAPVAGDIARVVCCCMSGLARNLGGLQFATRTEELNLGDRNP